MFYVICIICSFILAKKIEKKEKKIYLHLIVLIISLFCGLRAKTIGIDTINYYIYLDIVSKIGISYGSDIGFSIICYILIKIFNNPGVVILTISFITNYFIIFRFWDFRKKVSFSWMILIYLISYYPYTFNITRQFLAISIIFWGIRFIERGKRKRYILLNLIAISIHFSAAICLILNSLKIKKNILKFEILNIFKYMLFIVPLLIIGQEKILKYLQYFEIIKITIHPLTIFKIIFLIIIILTRGLDMKDIKNKLYLILYSISLVLISCGMFYNYLNRIGFYFILYEIPIWGQVLKKGKNCKLYKGIVVFILGYILLNMMLNDTAGLNNYKTFLEEK